MVVIDLDRATLPLTLSRDCLRFAYLSVGAAEDYRPYWQNSQDARYLVAHDKESEGSFLVDFRDPEWQKILTSEEIPRLLAQPVQGLLLANLDNMALLENQNPKKFAGSSEALKTWLSQLRKSHPDLLLIAEGTKELEFVAPFVDGYMIDGIWTAWDASSHRAQRLSRDATDARLKELENAQIVSSWPVFNMEYFDSGDIKTQKWLVKESVKHGFRPFLKIR